MNYRTWSRLIATVGLILVLGSTLGAGQHTRAREFGGEPESAAQATTFTRTRLTDNAADDTHPALAVDGNGKAHIVYEHDGNIYYATNAGGPWDALPIAASADDQYRPAIALDSAGAAHVAYFSGTPPSLDLIYATNAGGSWATELAGDVAMPATWNLHLSLALDGAGRPYIVYHYNVEYVPGTPEHHQIALRYRESSRNATPQGGWTTLLVTEHTANSQDPSIAVDGTGAIHVAYAGLDPLDPTALYPEIWHAIYNGSVWTHERLTNNTWQTDEHPSLALDSNHKAHIAWQVSDMGTTPEIVYGTNAGGTWITTTLTTNNTHDTHPSLALDDNDKIHVVYEHFGDRYYIHYTSNASGTWLTDTVASATVQSATLADNDYALAVDAAGYVHAVYQDDDGNDDEVWYARSDQPVGPPANQPPYTPGDPMPGHNSTGVPLKDNILAWQGGDPDPGDTVTYDIFFGASNPPPLLQSDWPLTTLTVTLAADTHYYWRVSARDNHTAKTDGPLWEFTTANNYMIFLPLVIR